MKSQFLLSVREFMQTRYYAKKTIEAYLHWITRYIHFHNKKHPSLMGDQEVEEFLTYLAVQGKVATKTQSLALNSLSFLYKEIQWDKIFIWTLLTITGIKKKTESYKNNVALS